jgi:excisionase family DNA binding protein
MTDRNSTEQRRDTNQQLDGQLLMTVVQVAALIQVPEQTVYAWSSQGRLDRCKTRVGKHVRFFRDELLALLREGTLNG